MSTELETERPPAGWKPMIFIGLGVAIIIMDATIVNVILPHIIKDLGINSVDAEWINAVYSLTFAAFLIVMGRLGDRFGRRKIFVYGSALFGFSSVLAANAPNGTLLIAARALQGIGGAMMSPTSLSLVNTLYRGKSRAMAFALYGSIIGGMAAVGPLVGGWLTQTFSWHWAFWINVPISIIIAVGAIRFVPESKAEGDVGTPDYLGAVASTLGTATLIFGLIEGRNYGWWKVSETKSFLGITWNQISPVPVALTISVIAFVTLFVTSQHRKQRNKVALIDFELFRIKTFGIGSFAGLIVSLGEFGILFSLPLYLQNALGWSTLGSAGLLAVLAVGAFIAAPTAAKLVNRRGSRYVTQVGLAFELIGILGIAFVASSQTSGLSIAFNLFIYGLGVGFATSQLTGLILADVPVEKSGQASGTQSTARQIGAAMGTAILGTVLFTHLEKYAYEQFAKVIAYTTAPVSDNALHSVAHAVQQSAGTIIPTLQNQFANVNGRFDVSIGPDMATAARDAFGQAVQMTALVAALFVFLGLLATFALPNNRPTNNPTEPDQSKLIQSFEE